MKTKKIIKYVLIIFLIGFVAAGGVVYYLFNMPDRDVQGAKADFQTSSTQLVEEYMKDATVANQKYLAENGESAIVEVSGTVANIEQDFNDKWVVLLQGEDDKAGVRCSFTEIEQEKIKKLKPGTEIHVKGVIESGANYDEDLMMYEHVNLGKCALI